MRERQSLTHVRWDCEYHLVIISKHCRRKLYWKVRKRIAETMRDACRQRGKKVIERHLMQDHIHMCVSIRPKNRVEFAISFVKDQSAVRVQTRIPEKNRVAGLHFWAREYCVSTLGSDEESVMEYMRDQETFEKRQQKLEFENYIIEKAKKELSQA